MTALLGAAFAHVLPWLAGLVALVVGAWGIHAAGKRDARQDAAQRAAEQSLSRQKEIADALDNVSHDPDWRGKLRDRAK